MRTFSSQRRRFREAWLGLVVAIGILSLWLSSLVALLSVNLSNFWIGWTVLAVLGRAFFHTGLFVIAHDAMHGSLVPHCPSINHRIGKVAVELYAFLPYDRCRVNHSKHHCYTAQSRDPDFHDGIHAHPVCWYLKFIREYLPTRRMTPFLLIWGLTCLSLHQFCQVPWTNLILFGIVPLLISSLQLFCFGTYLPHRSASSQTNPASSVTGSGLAILWSFLECYHFGHYHWEHHRYPGTPWYQLPAISRKDKSVNGELTGFVKAERNA